MVKYYTRNELLPLLILREERVTDESEDADNSSSEEDSSDGISGSESASDSGSNCDSMA